MPGPGHVLEDGVPVGVEGDGHTVALYQAPHQQEVVAGVLLLAEHGVDHDARGVVHGQQQREGSTMVSKPPVVAAVHLYQHARAGHPLPAGTVPGRSTVAWALQTGTRQYAPQCGSTDLYALALPEHSGECDWFPSSGTAQGAAPRTSATLASRWGARRPR